MILLIYVAVSNTRLSDTYVNELLSGLVRCAKSLHPMAEAFMVVVTRHDAAEFGIVKIELFDRGSVRVV